MNLFRALFLVFLTACSSAPEPLLNKNSTQLALNIPNQWEFQLPTELDLNAVSWGLELPESVKQMMASALEENKQLAITALKVKQGVVDVEIATGAQWPEIKVLSSHRVSQSIDSQSNKTSNKLSSLGINASWEVDLWRKLADETKQEGWSLLAKEQDLSAAQLSIQAQVITSWLSIIEQNNLLLLNKKNIANQERRLKMSMLRLDNGLANSIDIRNAKTSLMRLADSQQTLQFRHDQASRNLQLILGQYPNIKVLSALKLPKVDDVNFITLPQDILLNRPDVQAAESRLMASGYAWRVSEKKKLPKLALTFNYDAKKQKISDLFDVKYWLHSITASLAQPVFYRGMLSAQAEKAKLQQQIQLMSYQSSLLKAWQEVENALQNDQVLKTRQTLLNKALYQAQAAEQQTENQYTAGVATSFELLAAQRTRTSVETDVVKVAIARVKNRIKLTLALGLPSQSTNS